MTNNQELIKEWLKIGRRNPWIDKAFDPPFNEESFYKCQSLAELQQKLDHGNWTLGQAFYLDNICFIQQINGGNEWLVIRNDIAFESISYQNYQSEKFAKFYNDIKSASDQELRNLNYRSR